MEASSNSFVYKDPWQRRDRWLTEKWFMIQPSISEQKEEEHEWKQKYFLIDESLVALFSSWVRIILMCARVHMIIQYRRTPNSSQIKGYYLTLKATVICIKWHWLSEYDYVTERLNHWDCKLHVILTMSNTTR